MKHINKNNISSAASVTLNKYSSRNDYRKPIFRFLGSANALPASVSAEMQINFKKGEIPTVTAFSDAVFDILDYSWIFEDTAEVAEMQNEDISVSSEGITYLIAEKKVWLPDCAPSPRILLEELGKLGAVMNLTVSSMNSNRALLTLKTTKELPARVRTMLLGFFGGVQMIELTDPFKEPNKSLSFDVVSRGFASILQGISEIYDEENAPAVPDECGPSGKEEYCEGSTPIDALDLTVRSYNCLKRAGITTVERLCEIPLEELMRLRNLGKKNFDELVEKIRDYKSASANNSEPPKAPVQEKSGYEMLDELIGLNQVKFQVKRILSLARMQKDMAEKGIKNQAVTLNMVFTGNPGTAKTTVARILSRIMYEAGILKKPKALEVGRADLVGKYVGHTADLVKQVFKNAAGGLLFIDEAYSLVDAYENSFGDEAIDTIVQEMENHREDTVVVFAGYPKPMEEFFSRNPGLKSRVPFKIDFADYSPEEMLLISELDAQNRGFSISRKAKDKIAKICKTASADPENGNGRFCRNIIENAVLSYAARVYGEEEKVPNNDFVLQSDDFCDIYPKRKAEIKAPIGF